jgi:hypothetical protein
MHNNARSSRKVSGEQVIKLGEFPALRQFMHGYLHEDFMEEYGSAEDAAAEFCQDADPEEREQVADEWRRFLKATSELPINTVRKLMTEKFGSAWHFEDKDEFERFSSTLLKKHTH